MSTEKIDYTLAGEYADVVRALAIAESRENPYEIGDEGRAFGLLQMHPARFAEEFHFAWSAQGVVADTWAQAQIRACRCYLTIYEYKTLELRIMGWRLGKRAVFTDGDRDWAYLARVALALKEIGSTRTPKLAAAASEP